jgi:hypothetical protein
MRKKSERSDPTKVTRTTGARRKIVTRRIHESTEALANSFAAIPRLINAEAILIGARLPAHRIEQLAASPDERMAGIAAGKAC